MCRPFFIKTASLGVLVVEHHITVEICGKEKPQQIWEIEECCNTFLNIATRYIDNEKENEYYY